MPNKLYAPIFELETLYEFQVKPASRNLRVRLANTNDAFLLLPGWMAGYSKTSFQFDLSEGVKKSIWIDHPYSIHAEKFYNGLLCKFVLMDRFCIEMKPYNRSGVPAEFKC